MRVTWTLGLVLASAMLGACSDDGNTTDPLAIDVSGIVSDFLTAQALADVDVCLYPSTTDCTKTNAAGAFDLKVSVKGDIVISESKAGYITKLNPKRIGTVPAVSTSQITKTSDAALLAASLGVTLDPAKSTFTVNVFDDNGQPLSDVTFTVSGGDGDGPYYATGATFDKQLSKTTSAGLAVWLNASPGSREVIAKHATKTCTAYGAAQPGSASGSVKLPLVASDLSASGIGCK